MQPNKNGKESQFQIGWIEMSYMSNHGEKMMCTCISNWYKTHTSYLHQRH